MSTKVLIYARCSTDEAHQDDSNYIDNDSDMKYFRDEEDKLKMKCCETCQVHWTCETKWYRGERGEENACCPVCNYFKVCTAEKSKQGKDTKPK